MKIYTEEELREDLIENMEPLDPTDKWQSNRGDLRAHLLGDSSWDQWRTWPVVAATMKAGMIPSIEQELMLTGRKWANQLESLGKNNGTGVHQAYSLSLFEEKSGMDPRMFESIIEFGAGYGEMACILSYAGYRGIYYMLDFHEMILLQKYYLSSRGVDLTNFVFFSSMWQFVTYDWDRTEGVDFAIGICSLSEAPIHTRQVFVGVAPPMAALYRYQLNWDGNDNDMWFREYGDYAFKNVEVHEAPHFAHHATMIAWDPKEEDDES